MYNCYIARHAHSLRSVPWISVLVRSGPVRSVPCFSIARIISVSAQGKSHTHTLWLSQPTVNSQSTKQRHTQHTQLEEYVIHKSSGAYWAIPVNRCTPPQRRKSINLKGQKINMAFWTKVLFLMKC